MHKKALNAHAYKSQEVLPLLLTTNKTFAAQDNPVKIFAADSHCGGEAAVNARNCGK